MIAFVRDPLARGFIHVQFTFCPRIELEDVNLIYHHLITLILDRYLWTFAVIHRFVSSTIEASVRYYNVLFKFDCNLWLQYSIWSWIILYAVRKRNKKDEFWSTVVLWRTGVFFLQSPLGTFFILFFILCLLYWIKIKVRIETW